MDTISKEDKRKIWQNTKQYFTDIANGCKNQLYLTPLEFEVYLKKNKLFGRK